MNMFSDAGSIPAASTNWPKDEHLLFQRRLCRNGVVLRENSSQVSNLDCCFFVLKVDVDFQLNKCYANLNYGG